MMIQSALVLPVLRDYSDYIACAYGLAGFLLVALVVQSILSARKTQKSLEMIERDMARDGADQRDDDA